MALYNLRNNSNSPNRATNASSKAPKSSTLNVKQISPCSQPRSRRPKRKYIKPNRIATLKTLPDVPLLRLLSFLPHTQKLRVEKVCRRLRFMTRTTCLQQKTLILYQKSTLCQVLPMLTRYLFFTDGQSNLSFNGNMVEINKKSFRGIDTKIFDRFPVVKHLKIYHVDLPRFKDLFSLLDHYQETIETFELFCDEAHKRKFYHEALFEKLNKLPKLRHLYLPFDLQSKDFPVLWKEIREKCSTVFTQNFHMGNPAMHEERVLNPIRENPERISNPSDENICYGTFQQYNAYQEIQVFNKDSNLCGLGAYWGKFDALGDAVEQFHADAVVNTVTFQNGVPRLSHFTHLDLELPLNAQFEPFLESLSVHRNMTHLRLCVKDRFQVGENYRLIFNYVTPNNYRQLFCIVLPQVRFLTLSRFEFELDDPVLKLYLPHLFPNLERLHFEHCYFQSGFSMSVTEHFANLCQVWYNNGFLFDVKRKPAVETDEERRLRQLDMKNIDASG